MGQKLLEIRFNMHLPAVIKKKGKWYVSCCPALDVYSQGETKEKAKENLIEALSLFLISCYERNTLDDVLKNCGFRPVYKSIPNDGKENNLDYIDVPLPFMINTDDPHRCHA